MVSTQIRPANDASAPTAVRRIERCPMTAPRSPKSTPAPAPARLPEGLSGNAPLPLYQQLKQRILRQIESGAWPAHHRVPSEHELVEELGVSRMTINRALRELTAEGVLIRMQGVGTFVAQRKARSALFSVNSIADEIAARGHVHRSRVLRLAQENATLDQALALDIREGDAVFHSIIVHYENDVPIQLEDRYVNAQMAPDYLAQDFTQTTPYAYLSDVAPLTAGEHVVEAVLAKPRECQWLQIERSEPCLLICRRTWSGERTVTYTRLLHPGARHRLEGKFST